MPHLLPSAAFRKETAGGPGEGARFSVICLAGSYETNLAA